MLIVFRKLVFRFIRPEITQLPQMTALTKESRVENLVGKK